ncbi:MAG: hypothetical protein A3I75_02480 [Deltaproteobacteria bacterium RIFCSPLOWO2_02_FULL_50_16]|nr:MAG: hypothetical protein A2053_03245 [Deltaproteobacteria bacterium GWA2_50_8]OGQ29493.1 MAG: hypothetical protein A3B79_00715 [Deltaproteobacteria bacterium RIFCSPHIGHO2_02_FULL_50_15]OGQ58313.1 MAG: hypothetical protein A3I75_02480 [Deltaproteobacteria bacterium RIFCSPLOWO2_02_FULL_50_16]OGQ66621.1 MAG: hypothetical protein A3F89_05965 [Deltaproteobacteria bacterium RIFCSPLOWO2_12_FULL_50_11]
MRPQNTPSIRRIHPSQIVRTGLQAPRSVPKSGLFKRLQGAARSFTDSFGITEPKIQRRSSQAQGPDTYQRWGDTTNVLHKGLQSLENNGNTTFHQSSSFQAAQDRDAFLLPYLNDYINRS